MTTSGNSPDDWYSLGQTALSQARFADAESAFRSGLESEPDHAGCLLGLGRVLEATKQFEAAAMSYRHLLTRLPDQVDALKGLARVLMYLGCLPEAYHLARRARELAPDDPNTHFVLGSVLLRMQRPQDSLECLQRARDLLPTAQAEFSLASPLLQAGDFEAGWKAYESRLATTSIVFKIPAVREHLWNGQPIDDQTLLIHTEQGFGDTLQFIRYLPLVRDRVGRNARVMVLCEPELAGIVATVRGADEIVVKTKNPRTIEFHWQIPLLSLPHRFGTTLPSIPAEVPYIRRPAGSDVRYRRPADARLVVAFAWAGRPGHDDERMRSCSIDYFGALFDLRDMHFVSVQTGARAEDITPYLARPNVASVHQQLADFSSTLAVLDEVDLVISVDTALAHLAGAYGKPVWLLLPLAAEWRWMVDREDTPWYPSARLFRQRLLGDWAGTFARVSAELARRLEAVAAR